MARTHGHTHIATSTVSTIAWYRRLGFVALTALILTPLTGCVAQEKYNAVLMANQQQREQLNAAQSQVSAATAQNEVFKKQMEQIRNSGDNTAALLVNQAATIADQARQIEDLNSRYKLAMDNMGKVGSAQLPVQLTNELTSFAAEHPDQVDFDPARGLVKFKSDVTFDAGSAVVKDNAKQAIDRLASILNGPVASQYDLMVVGHTDNHPVGNQATIRAGHFDNWYLSAHRAISVSKELRGQGVSPARMEIAGYADQRPIDTAGTKEADAHNRRVEVLILPTTGHSTPVAPAASPVAQQTAPKATPARGGLNKDESAEAERRSVLNK